MTPRHLDAHCLCAVRGSLTKLVPPNVWAPKLKSILRGPGWGRVGSAKRGKIPANEESVSASALFVGPDDVSHDPASAQRCARHLSIRPDSCSLMMLKRTGGCGLHVRVSPTSNVILAQKQQMKRFHRHWASARRTQNRAKGHWGLGRGQETPSIKIVKTVEHTAKEMDVWVRWRFRLKPPQILFWLT